MAASTLRARLTQWKCYLRFCRAYRLSPLPCSSDCLSIYAAYLLPYMTYSSIVTYIQAVVFVHKVKGLTPPSSADVISKITLDGIKRVSSGHSRKRDPITLSHLKRLYSYLDVSSPSDLLFWSICLFLFRTLLRVSHVVSSPHTLYRKDVKFTSWGMWIYVRSSKTNQLRNDTVKIPVYNLPLKSFCAVFWLRRLYDCQDPKYKGPLFSLPAMPYLTYSWFQSKLKKSASDCMFKSSISSHSFRKGGATFLASCGVPLDQIKSRGMWKSMSVLRYLSEHLHVRVSREKSYCEFFTRGLAFG